MLRAWYAGMPVRKAAEHYVPDRIAAGQSARGACSASFGGKP
jgi:hypothetical protein